MNHESAWERLLVSLKTWSDVREVPGGVEATFRGRAGARRTVQVIMTAEEWDELSQVVQIESPDSLKDRLLALEDDEHLLVYDAGVELIASSTRDLPPDELTHGSPEPGGGWVVTDDAGNVVSRFSDWNKETIDEP